MKAPESYFENSGLIEGQKSPARIKVKMSNIFELQTSKKKGRKFSVRSPNKNSSRNNVYSQPRSSVRDMGSPYIGTYSKSFAASF